MAARRRPMSAATKAKIAASLKGNKNAYKNGGSKKPGAGQVGGKRGANGVKQIRNKGYGKRRAAANLLGAAAVGVLSVNAVKGAQSKHFTRSNKKGKDTRLSVAIGTGAAAGIAHAVARSHKIGMAKRNARKNGTVLIVGKSKGRTNAYVPGGPKKSSVPHQSRALPHKKIKTSHKKVRKAG